MRGARFNYNYCGVGLCQDTGVHLCTHLLKARLEESAWIRIQGTVCKICRQNSAHCCVTSVLTNSGRQMERAVVTIVASRLLATAFNKLDFLLTWCMKLPGVRWPISVCFGNEHSACTLFERWS